MVSVAEKTKTSLKDPFKELCEVYVLYFDEARGHVPLLIYPSEKMIDDKKYMRVIRFHPVWFLEIEESEALNHIDLEYKGYNFMAKKFLAKSSREKRRAGLEEKTPETIVIILSLPTDVSIFGDDLVQNITTGIKENFGDKFSELISGTIAKDEIIKTPAMKEKIVVSDGIKENMKNLIGRIGNNYLSRVIRQADGSSLKKQKAISYLYLKGFDFSHITMEDGAETYSTIQLFDPSKKKEEGYTFQAPFSLININIDEESKELQILVKNNTETSQTNLTVKITHVREFFEKEIMNQLIEEWFPEEELLFISPIIPHINEYLFFVLSANEQKLLSKKIDLELLNSHINSN